MGTNKEHFGLTSDKIVGKFKDELGGRCIDSFCALNPKCYSYTRQLPDGVKNTKKCKGVSSVVVKKEITHEDFKNTLATGATLLRNTMSFRSVRQQMYTVAQSKKALTTFYDKLQMQDAYTNLPYGYIDAVNQGINA